MKHEQNIMAAALTVNVANILRVADAIERNEIASVGFNMSEAISISDNFGITHDMTGRGCGTVACIAGWTCLMHGDSVERIDASHWSLISTRAAKILGLDEYQARLLFAPNQNVLEDITVKQAVSTLRSLASTGMVTWPDDVGAHWTPYGD